MDDDLYPNDSTYFSITEPAEQSVARKKEKAKTLEALAVIKDVIDHFEQRIADRDKLSAIKVDITKDPALHQKLCEVNELLKLALIQEKSFLEDLLEANAANR